MTRRMLAPIVSIKHYIHQTLLTVTGGTVRNVTIAEAVVAPAAANAFDVVQGSVIKAVYVELWFVGTGSTGTLTSFNLTIEKTVGDQTDMTFTQSTNLGTYPNKKNILYTTQGNIGTFVDGTNPIPLFRAWIKIPKGKQRMGLGDNIMLNVNSVGSNSSICGFFTYKEYQ